MTITEEIRAKLSDAFDPSVLEVRDVSESHRGHAGYREGGESHFDVVIRASAFKGKSRIAQHRAVHAAIGKDLIGKIHALSIDIGA
ncbi:BolA family protein [Aliiroseovarius sp. YM-037]|uniref:BolA family protein n=1 Tax=Aliiroseovarius sp. YM-037 TaxID=3341728 RepID=UPI003A800D96